MKVVVWVREIPDTRDLVGELLGADSMPRWKEWDTRMDPEDLNSLEMALQWKDRDQQLGLTAVSVGEPKKLDVLRECLYRGVDQVLRLSGIGNSEDIVAEAQLVAAAVRKLDAQVVFTGVQLNETECGHKGVFLARALGWPVVTYVEAMEQGGSRAGAIRLRRAVEQGVEVVEAEAPLVISVGVALLKEDPRAPRSARAKLKLQHKKTPIPRWDSSELGSLMEQGACAPRILSFRVQPQRLFPARRVDGSDEQELRAMLEELRAQGLVR